MSYRAWPPVTIVLVLCLLVNALGDLLPTSVETVSDLGLKDV